MFSVASENHLIIDGFMLTAQKPFSWALQVHKNTIIAAFQTEEISQQW